MKYRCIACDSEFEVEPGQKPRCPKCLSIHDFERISQAKAGANGRGRNWLAPAIVLGIAAVVLGVYFFWVQDKPGDGQSGAADPNIASDLPHILEEMGLSPGEAVDPFAITSELTAFAREVAGSKKGVDALKALHEAIVKQGRAGAWRPHHQREPRAGDVFTATQLLNRINAKDAGPVEALSYELAALLLSCVQSLEVEATMVEISGVKGVLKPVDPPGKLGRYGVIAGTANEGSPVFDPFGHQVIDTTSAEIVELNDALALAPYYGLKALAVLADHDTAQALKLNDIAIKLFPMSPYLHTGRGLIFAASGAPGESVAEFEKAVKLRDNAVFRANLAEITMLADPTGQRTEAEIQAALKHMPEYGRAHALLAMVLLMRGDVGQAEQELAIADRMDPGSPSIAMFWAQLHASQAKSEQAIEKAQEAVRLSNESVSSLLGLAQIFRLTARFDEMRITLDKVIAKSNSPVMNRQIKELFGYASEAEEGADVESGDDGSDEKLELKLGNGLGQGLTDNKPSLGGEQLKLDLDLNNPK
ncbi:MAG: tetratricopeptide repeat protein [Myxococcota bacterium]|nr:tetratricopeptide repeat protein [Myxococcota bacterium]